MYYYIITNSSRDLGKALAEAALQQPDTMVIGVCRHATIQHERYRHQPLDLSDMLAVQNNLHKVFPAFPDAASHAHQQRRCAGVTLASSQMNISSSCST